MPEEVRRVGKRDKKDPRKYRAGKLQDGIVPDYVSSSVGRYFAIPPVWIGNEPEDEHKREFNAESYYEEKLRRKLKCGIEVSVLRDGTFSFDFFDYKPASQTFIPGYHYDGPRDGVFPLPAHQRAEEHAAEISMLRVRILNVHQCLLAEAECNLTNSRFDTGVPLEPYDVEGDISIDRRPNNIAIPQFISRRLLRPIFNNVFAKSGLGPFSRRTVKLEYVNLSLDYLDKLLLEYDLSSLDIIEEASIAPWHAKNARYGSCILSYWAAIEMVISTMWARNLNARNITGDRKKTLLDYTVSTKVEFLLGLGLISEDLFDNIDSARKARNKWAHESAQPSSTVMWQASKAASELLTAEFGIRFNIFPRGKFPGGQAWPIWLDDRAIAKFALHE